MADRSRWDYGERDRERDRYRASRYDRGDETNRGMFGYEGEGYLRGGGRDIDDRDVIDDYGRSNYGGNRGRDSDRTDRYGSAGREFRGRDYNAGGNWGGGSLRTDYDRTTRDVAGYRGTGYLGGDYGQARLDRNDDERDYSRDTFGETRGISETTSYRGRGPKNYQRSDDRIREDVCERLERDHRVDASDLEVNVSGGVVTLSGSVHDREMKRRAEDIAESCGGVSDVQNQIRVARRES
jgi:osmotically-inducible protein OsmY